MENILRDLFPYLIILYLADCVTYIKSNEILFVSYWGKTFKIKGPGLHFVGLFPVARAFVCDDLPFIVTPTGLFTVENTLKHSTPYRDDDFVFVPYDSIDKIVLDGKITKLDDYVSLATSSSIRAKHTAQLIYEMKNTVAVNRIEKIETATVRATDIALADTSGGLYKNTFLLLSSFCASLFGCTFFVLATLLYLNVLQVVLPYLVGFMLLNYFIILGLVVYLHSKVFPGERMHLVHILISMVLLPMSSMHAQIYLSRDMFSCFDKVTLASKYLPSVEFNQLIAKELLIAKYSKELSQNDSLRDFWNRRDRALNHLLQLKGISKLDIFSVPEQQDPRAASYCPLCEAEYRSGFELCADCSVVLEKFASGDERRGSDFYNFSDSRRSSKDIEKSPPAPGSPQSCRFQTESDRS